RLLFFPILQAPQMQEFLSFWIVSYLYCNRYNTVLLASSMNGGYHEDKKGRGRMTEATLARRATEIPTETRQELDGTNAEHGEVSYPLSPFAVSVLSRITYDDMKDYELTTSQADLLTTGI